MKPQPFAVIALSAASLIGFSASAQTPGGPGDLSPHIDIGVDASTGQLAFGYTDIEADTPIVIDLFFEFFPGPGISNFPFTADQDIALRTATDDIAAGLGFSSFGQFGQSSPAIGMEVLALDPDFRASDGTIPLVDSPGDSLILNQPGQFLDVHPIYFVATDDPGYIGRVESTWRFVPLTSTGTFSASDTFDLIFVVGGDYDDDSRLTVVDIDTLSGAVRDGATGVEFDLSRDGSLDQEDRRVWVEELFATRFGDANLDGDVDVFQFDGGGDAQILTSNLGTASGAGWGDGDFSGDGDVDVFQFDGNGDAQLLTTNLGFSGSSVTAVASAASAAASSVAAGEASGTYDPTTGEIVLTIGSGVGVVGFESASDSLLPDNLLSGALAAAQATESVIAFFSATGLTPGEFDLGAIVEIGTPVSDLGFSFTPLGGDSVIASLTVIPEPTSLVLLGLGFVGMFARRRKA